MSLLLPLEVQVEQKAFQPVPLMDSFLMFLAEQEVPRAARFPSVASMAALMEALQAAAAALISAQGLAWLEQVEAFLLAAAAAALLLTTASPLALAVLAAMVPSSSSPTANL